MQFTTYMLQFIVSRFGSGRSLHEHNQGRYRHR